MKRTAARWSIRPYMTFERPFRSPHGRKSPAIKENLISFPIFPNTDEVLNNLEEVKAVI